MAKHKGSKFVRVYVEKPAPIIRHILFSGDERKIRGLAAVLAKYKLKVKYYHKYLLPLESAYKMIPAWLADKHHKQKYGGKA